MSAPPDAIAYHQHVTEREPGPDIDCTWASTVEFLHDCYDLSIPVTQAEMNALRAASGDVGQSNLADVRRGVGKRYPKIQLNPSWTGWAEVEARLTPGRAGVVAGKLINMDAHYQRWYPGYTGGHRVYVACTDVGEYWWCDPGAPVKRANGTPYLGELITKSQLRAYVGVFGFDHIFKDLLPLAAKPAPPTYTQAQLDAAVAAATLPLNARIAAAKVALG